jgi:hypothetical protein
MKIRPVGTESHADDDETNSRLTQFCEGAHKVPRCFRICNRTTLEITLIQPGCLILTSSGVWRRDATSRSFRRSGSLACNCQQQAVTEGCVLGCIAPKLKLVGPSRAPKLCSRFRDRVRAGWTGFESQCGKHSSFSTSPSRPAPKTHSFHKRYRGPFSGVKRPDRETDHSSPFTLQFKIDNSYIYNMA